MMKALTRPFAGRSASGAANSATGTTQGQLLAPQNGPHVMRRPVLLMVLLFSLVMTGCVGTRMGVDGAALSLVGEEQNILVAYNDALVQVNPRDGRPVQLRNADGEIRIDPDTNQARLWLVQSGGDLGQFQFFSPPLWLNDNTLLVADYHNRMFEVDVEAARIDATTVTPTTGQIIAGLVSDGERVFLPFSEQNLQAVNLETYDQEWVYETDNAIWKAPLLHEGVLYFGSLDHHVYAVDSETGEELWRADLEGAVAGTPILSEDGETLYAGSFAGKVAAIARETGDILNTFDVANWVWGSPQLYDDILYTADLSGNVYALSADDGLSEIWSVKATDGGIAAAPLVTPEYVVVASRFGEVKWLNRNNGSIAFERNVEAEVLSDILLIEPTESLDIPSPLVIVSTHANDKILVAFNLNNSAELWRYGR